MRLSRRTAGTVALVAVIAGFLTLMGIGLANREPVTGNSGITRVGKPASMFVLPGIGDVDVALADYIGKPIVINFWSSWCPPCAQEAPVLEDAWRRHAGDGVQFIGVDIQDADEDAAAYVAEYDVTYPNGMDRDGRVTVDYGVIGLPVTFFVNRAGIVERRWVGAIGEGELESRVAELLAGAAAGDEDAQGGNLDKYFELN